MQNEDVPWTLKWFLILGFFLIIVHSIERMPIDLDSLKVVVGIPVGLLSKTDVEKLNVVEIPPMDGGISAFIKLCDFDRLKMNGFEEKLAHNAGKDVIFLGKPPEINPKNMAVILDRYDIVSGIVEFDESTDYMLNVIRMRKEKWRFFRVHRIKEREYTKLGLDQESALKRWKRAVLERSVDLLYVLPPPKNWKVDYRSYVGKIVKGLKPFLTKDVKIPPRNWRSVYSFILALITGFVIFQAHSSFLSIPYVILVVLAFLGKKHGDFELLAFYIGALGPVSLFYLGRRKFNLYLPPAFFLGFGAVVIGYTVNSILSDFYHITQLYTYRGVKLSILLLPSLVFIREFFDEERGFLKRKASFKILDFLMLLIVILSGIYYVLRSGNYSLVLNVERKFRDAIETFLFVRPRFKELVGYAFLLIALRADSPKILGRYNFILPVVGSMGIVGTVNTFCHIKAPLFVDLYRSFLGITIGYLTGYILMKIFRVK